MADDDKRGPKISDRELQDILDKIGQGPLQQYAQQRAEQPSGDMFTYRVQNLIEKMKHKLETPTAREIDLDISLEDLRPQVQDMERTQEFFREFIDKSQRMGKDTTEAKKQLQRIEKTTEIKQRRLEALSDRRDRYEQTRQQIARSQFESQIATAVGEPAAVSNIAKMMRDRDILGQGTEMAATVPSARLEERHTELSKQIMQQAKTMQELARDTEYGDNTERMMAEADKYKQLMREQASVRVAQAAQRRQRTDVESGVRQAEQFETAFKRQSQQQAIQAGVAAGVFGNEKQATEKLVELQTQLTKAMEAFKDSLSGTTDEVDAAHDAFRKASTAYEKQEKVVDEMRRQGGGGGGRDTAGFLGNAALSAGQAIGAGFSMFGAMKLNEAQTLIQTEQARGTLMRLSNERFREFVAAGQGDVTMQRRMLNNRVYAEVVQGMEAIAPMVREGQAEELKGTEITAATSLVGNFVEGFSAGSGAAPGNPVAKGLAGLALGFTKAFSGAAASATDIQRRELQLQSNVGSIAAGESLAAAKRVTDIESNLVTDTVKQRYFDVMHGMVPTTRGFGGERERIARESEQFMFSETAANFMLHPEEVTAMVESARPALGRRFGRNATRDLEMATVLSRGEGGPLESTGQYFQLRGQMYGAMGTNLEQFSKIISTAMAAGIDDSKLIPQMVQNLSAISSNTGKVTGTDTSVQLMNMIATSMKMSKGLGLEPVVAMRRATEGAALVSQMTSEGGYGISTIAEGIAMRQFQGLTHADAQTLQRKSLQTLRTIQEAKDRAKTGDPQAQREYDALVMREGLLNFEKRYPNWIEKGIAVKYAKINAAITTAAQMGGIPADTMAALRERIQALKPGEKLRDEDVNLLGQLSTMHDMPIDAVYMQTFGKPIPNGSALAEQLKKVSPTEQIKAGTVGIQRRQTSEGREAFGGPGGLAKAQQAVAEFSKTADLQKLTQDINKIVDTKTPEESITLLKSSSETIYQSAVLFKAATENAKETAQILKEALRPIAPYMALPPPGSAPSVGGRKSTDKASDIHQLGGTGKR